MTTAPDPTRCPHLGRTFRIVAGDPNNPIIDWTCIVCGTTGLTDGWASFDHAAGCADWRRGRCRHERCKELREMVRSEGR